MKRTLFLILFVAFLFFVLGMFTQAHGDHAAFQEKASALLKEFQKRGLDLGKNSFEYGCITQGTDSCTNQSPGEDEFNTWMRNNCYQITIDRCRDKAANYYDWLSQKPPNVEEVK